MQKNKALKKQMIFQAPQLKSPTVYLLFFCFIIYLSLGLWGRDPWRQSDLIYFVKFKELLALPFHQIIALLTENLKDIFFFNYFSNGSQQNFYFFNQDTAQSIILIQSLVIKTLSAISSSAGAILFKFKINDEDVLRLFFVLNTIIAVIFLQKSQKVMSAQPDFQLISHPFHSPEQEVIWQRRYEKILAILPVILWSAAMGAALYLHEGTQEVGVLSIFSALLFCYIKHEYAEDFKSKLSYGLFYGFLCLLISAESASFLLLTFTLQLLIVLYLLCNLFFNFFNFFYNLKMQPAFLNLNFHQGQKNQHPINHISLNYLKIFEFLLHLLLLICLILKFQSWSGQHIKIFSDEGRTGEWLREFLPFSWPLLPLAIYGFLQRPRALMVYLLSIVAISWVYILGADFSRQILVLTLPPFIILASWGLVLLPASWHKMAINLAGFLFIALALALALILLAWQNPIHTFYFWPELAFVNQYISPWAYVKAVAIFVFAIWAYRYGKKYQQSVIYPAFVWALGLFSCWLIFIVLYLPAINQVKTYREVVKSLNLYVPAKACVYIEKMDVGQEAALRYFAHFDIKKEKQQIQKIQEIQEVQEVQEVQKIQQEKCHFLIKIEEKEKKAENAKQLIQEAESAESAESANILLWQGSRLMSKKEIFTLYKIKD